MSQRFRRLDAVLSLLAQQLGLAAAYLKHEHFPASGSSSQTFQRYGERTERREAALGSVRR